MVSGCRNFLPSIKILPPLNGRRALIQLHSLRGEWSAFVYRKDDVLLCPGMELHFGEKVGLPQTFGALGKYIYDCVSEVLCEVCVCPKCDLS